jgi:hypothetical protein
LKDEIIINCSEGLGEDLVRLVKERREEGGRKEGVSNSPEINIIATQSRFPSFLKFREI